MVMVDNGTHLLLVLGGREGHDSALLEAGRGAQQRNLAPSCLFRFSSSPLDGPLNWITSDGLEFVAACCWLSSW